jgi:hypothetical protein
LRCEEPHLPITPTRDYIFAVRTELYTVANSFLSKVIPKTDSQKLLLVHDIPNPDLVLAHRRKYLAEVLREHNLSDSIWLCCHEAKLS